jgi:hypothetical protein
MTISSETIKSSVYVGNGVTTSFAFAFKVFSKNDIKLTKTLIADGSQTFPVLDSSPTGFSVSLNADQDNNPGGTVTYPISGTPMDSASNLVISCIMTNTQGTDITSGGGFEPEIIEDALDRCTILIKQLLEKVNRCLKFPISDSTALSTEVTTATLRANKFLAFNASGEPTVVAAITETPVSVFVSTLLDDASAGAFMTTLRGGLSAETTLALNDELMIYDLSEGTFNTMTVLNFFLALTLEAAETTVALDDEVILADVSEGAINRMTVANFLKSFTLLTGETSVAANDELPLVDVSAGTIDKVTVTDLFEAINTLTEDTSPDTASDFLLTFDTSAGTVKKAKPQNLAAGNSVPFLAPGTYYFPVPSGVTTMYYWGTGAGGGGGNSNSGTGKGGSAGGSGAHILKANRRSINVTGIAFVKIVVGAGGLTQAGAGANGLIGGTTTITFGGTTETLNPGDGGQGGGGTRGAGGSAGTGQTAGAQGGLGAQGAGVSGGGSGAAQATAGTDNTTNNGLAGATGYFGNGGASQAITAVGLPAQGAGCGGAGGAGGNSEGGVGGPGAVWLEW